jgi:hypothetical protein
MKSFYCCLSAGASLAADLWLTDWPVRAHRSYDAIHDRQLQSGFQSHFVAVGLRQFIIDKITVIESGATFDDAFLLGRANAPPLYSRSFLRFDSIQGCHSHGASEYVAYFGR